MTATADFVATEGDHSFTADEETHALYLKHTTGLSVTLDGVPAEEGETVAVYVPFGTHHLTAKIGGNDWSADIPFTEGANTYDFNEMKLIYSAMPGEGVGINGRVHMYFPVDGKALEGTTAVVFEKLHHFSLQKIRRKSSRMKRGTTASVSQPITEQHS